MLNGKVIPSERPDHYMLETWNPLGNVGVISAFNFPVAVYGWNRYVIYISDGVEREKQTKQREEERERERSRERERERDR